MRTRRWRKTIIQKVRYSLAGLCVVLFPALSLCLAAAPGAVHEAQPSAAAESPLTPAQALRRSEEAAKVVVSILGYVRWPQEIETIHLCVIGATQYASSLLDTASVRTPEGQGLDISRSDGEAVDASICNAVYAGDIPAETWRAVIRGLDGGAIVIGENPALCQVGGMFCLNWNNGEAAPSFEVNLDSVARGKLRVNPHVLQLARRNQKNGSKRD